MTDAEFFASGVGCIRLTTISHLLILVGVTTIPHMISDSQSLIPSLQNRIYHGTSVGHIVTNNYVAAEIARDQDIDLSYRPTT
jgi:hypothetical protein